MSNIDEIKEKFPIGSKGIILKDNLNTNAEGSLIEIVAISESKTHEPILCRFLNGAEYYFAPEEIKLCKE